MLRFTLTALGTLAVLLLAACSSQQAADSTAAAQHGSDSNAGRPTNSTTVSSGEAAKETGLTEVGSLWMSCKVEINTYGEAAGLAIKIYNPSPSPAPLTEIGVDVGDNGILVSQQNLSNGDGPVPASTTVTLQSLFDGALAANSCYILDWRGSTPGSGGIAAPASPSPAPIYTYSQGWSAASAATYIDLDVAASIEQHGEDLFARQVIDNDWCVSNDPSTDASGNDSNGTATGDSSDWYDGCLAELRAHPPARPVITPSSPGYEAGYALGKEANANSVEAYGGAQSWCAIYADPEGNYAPGGGHDQNPKDDPAIVGCIAALLS